jgi:predicted alpha/beta-fold hydrolase
VRRIPFHRERWETPDDDFIDVDHVPGPPSTPILIVLPGLEGSTRSKQITGLLAAAKAKGWRGIGVNFRSCSGQPNRGRRSYHGGETSDLAWIVSRAMADSPGSPLLCAGVSLGGNILLKYMGEQGESLPPSIRAAVAISTPFDLAESVRTLERGWSQIYMTRLVRSLKAKAFAKLKKYPD